MKLINSYGRITGLLLLIVVVVALSQARQLDIDAIIQQLGELGPLAWLAYIAFYALATVLFIPGSVLTLAGGSLFGPVLGTFVNLTGATLGAGLAFLLSRYLAANWVEQKTAGRLRQLKEGVEGEGWRFVAFVRLVPLFPFNLLNYALGLTRIRFLHYLIASYVSMLPGAAAYSYLGYAGREALANGEGLMQKLLLALALMAVLAFLPRMISRYRQGAVQIMDDLSDRLNSGQDLLLLDVRSGEDYQGALGHISVAQNIPLESLESSLSQLMPFKQKTIAIICTTERRSRKAAELLGRHGFSNVKVVTGGMQQWNKAGLPLSSAVVDEV